MSNEPLRVVLVDINRNIVSQWKKAFGEEPGIEVVQGSMLEQEVDAWVSPTNASGSMDGGLDAQIAGHIDGIAAKVKAAIAEQYEGFLPVGSATCVETGQTLPRFLISTPTMVGSSEDVSGTLNAALACAAAFQAVHLQNRREPGSITSVAMSGLGSNTGQVPPAACARLMWSGYQLYREYRFRDFASMRGALAAQLAEMAPAFARKKRKYTLPKLFLADPEQAPYTQIAPEQD